MEFWGVLNVLTSRAENWEMMENISLPTLEISECRGNFTFSTFPRLIEVRTCLAIPQKQNWNDTEVLFHFVEAVTFLIQPGAFGLMGLDPFTNQHKFNTTEKNKNPEKRKIHRNWNVFSHEWPSLDAKVKASTGQPIVYERLVNA